MNKFYIRRLVRNALPIAILAAVCAGCGEDDNGPGSPGAVASSSPTPSSSASDGGGIAGEISYSCLLDDSSGTPSATPSPGLPGCANPGAPGCALTNPIGLRLSADRSTATLLTPSEQVFTRGSATSDGRIEYNRQNGTAQFRIFLDDSLLEGEAGDLDMGPASYRCAQF